MPFPAAPIPATNSGRRTVSSPTPGTHQAAPRQSQLHQPPPRVRGRPPIMPRPSITDFSIYPEISWSEQYTMPSSILTRCLPPRPWHQSIHPSARTWTNRGSSCPWSGKKLHGGPAASSTRLGHSCAEVHRRGPPRGNWRLTTAAAWPWAVGA